MVSSQGFLFTELRPSGLLLDRRFFPHFPVHVLTFRVPNHLLYPPFLVIQYPPACPDRFSFSPLQSADPPPFLAPTSTDFFFFPHLWPNFFPHFPTLDLSSFRNVLFCFHYPSISFMGFPPLPQVSLFFPTQEPYAACFLRFPRPPLFLFCEFCSSGKFPTFFLPSQKGGFWGSSTVPPD